MRGIPFFMAGEVGIDELSEDLDALYDSEVCEAEVFFKAKLAKEMPIWKTSNRCGRSVSRTSFRGSPPYTSPVDTCSQPLGFESLMESEMADVRKLLEQEKLIIGFRVDGCVVGHRDTETGIPHQKSSPSKAAGVIEVIVISSTPCTSRRQPRGWLECTASSAQTRSAG